MDNAPKKIYKFIPFFDNGNSKVNKRNIETIEEKKVWASKYFSLNDPFEFNGMYTTLQVFNKKCRMKHFGV